MNPNKLFSFPVLLALILAATACATPVVPPAPVPSRLPSPTTTAESIPSLTAFPRPTSTQIHSPSPRPTETLFPVLTTTPTPPGLALLPPAAPGAPEGASPNGGWLWRVAPGDPGLENYQVLHLVKKDGSQKWSVGFERGDFEKAYTDINIEYIPVFWLPKEPYVFLAGLTCCDAFPIQYYAGFRLARLNLETGRLSVLIPGKIGDHTYFSFSLTGTYFLYTRAQRRGVHIQRLSSGEERLIQTPADYTGIGHAFWSPDDSKVVMEACQANAERPAGCAHHPLFVIDINRSTFRLLITDTRELWTQSPDAVSSVFWLNPDQISIHMASGSSWRLDLRSGKRQCYTAEFNFCPAQTP